MKREAPVLSASILAADFSRLGAAIQEAESAGADWIHVDVMDGHFVPTLTMGPVVVSACRRVTQLPLDVHLMVDNPDDMLEDFAHAGASGLTVQAEVCPHLFRTLESIRGLGLTAGVALNPGTPVAVLEDVMTVADLILIMTVNPGASGQPFLEAMLPKITRAKAMRDGADSRAWIEVDGGINAKTAGRAAQAGGEAFVAGQAIFGHAGGIRAGIVALRGALPAAVPHG